MKFSDLVFFFLLKKGKLTRENVIQLIEAGINTGVFDYEESRTIRNIINLRKVKAKDIMIPRVFVTTVSEELTISEFQTELLSKTFLHFPVYSLHKNTITGYVSKQDIFESLLTDDKEVRIGEIKQNVLLVSEDESAYYVWTKLMGQDIKLVIVVDSFDEFQGIISIEDITETVVSPGLING